MTLFSVGLGLLAAEGSASATHKNWVLKNSGDDCTFATPKDSDDTYFGMIRNNESGTRLADCPVALSARWGNTADSQSLGFAPARWGSAMSANVYVETLDQPMTCWAVGQTADGVLHYSNSTTVYGAGFYTYQTVVVASHSNWGGDLEANESQTLMSLDFQCNVPTSATIMGYKVKICQELSFCDDGNSNHDNGLDVPDGRESYVQTNGIDCVPKNNSTDGHLVTRSTSGITNTGTQWAQVVCPIALAADDSYEHPRQIHDTHVYYSGAQAYAGCENDGTCPQCNLEWITRTGVGDLNSTAAFASSPLFSYDVIHGAVGQPFGIYAQTQYEIGAQVSCWLPVGATLKGITSTMSLTRMSDGT